MEFQTIRNNESYWLMLPNDILQSIAQLLLKDLAHYIRFRAVCKKWREATLDPKHIYPCHLPWLLLSFDENSCERSFYRFSDQKIITLHLPETLNSRIVGSTEGWLVMVDRELRITLFNPLTRRRVHVSSVEDLPHKNIELESGDEMRDLSFSKLILCEPERLIVALIDVCIGFKLPSACNWARSPPGNTFDDILNYNGKLYALDYMFRSICMFDMSCPGSEATRIARYPSNDDFIQANLVESSGDLLLVIGFQNSVLLGQGAEDHNGYCDFRTYKFEIYKLKFHNDEEAECVPLRSLDDQALFIGTGRAMSFSAKEYPGAIRPNCIYFTNRFIAQSPIFPGHRGDDCGIFDLTDGTVRNLPYVEPPLGRALVWPPPVWMLPNLSHSIFE